MDRDIVRFLLYFVIGIAIFVMVVRWMFAEYVFY